MFDPKRMADVLAELHARRGYARVRTTLSAERAWSEAAGEPFAGQTRFGVVRRGTAEIVVANSLVAQEILFQKEQILRRLDELLPDEKIKDLRCKIGAVK